MNQQPLFSTSASPVDSHPLVKAAMDQVDQLEAAGLLGDPIARTRAQLAVTLARSIAESVLRSMKPYSLSNLSDSLNNVLENLPVAATGDAWETWVDLLLGLCTARDEDRSKPTFATKPTPGAPHQTESVAAVATMLGTPLMPWQRLAARIVTERTMDGSRWRWPVVVITVPRQAGKTTLFRCVYVQRALTRPGTSAWITAQTGKDATARWRDIIKAVTHSPLEPFIETRLSAGSSWIRFTRNDSQISPFAPTPDSLHGYTLTDAVIDEAFAFDDTQGADLLGAIDPAQSTIDDSQLIIVSTAGSAESTWLKSWVDKGRQAVKEKNSDIAYIEYSSAATSDWYSDEALAFHPAYGHTISAESLKRSADRMPVNEWRRAYLNQWVESSAGEPLADPRLWTSQMIDLEPPPSGRLVAVSYEAAYDRSRACVWTAWLDDDNRVNLHLVADQPGVTWIPDQLPGIMAAIGDTAVLVADDGGPTRQITEQLTKLGTTLRVLTGRENSSACSGFLGRLNDGTIIHDQGDDVAAELAVAASRPINDGWTISRRHSGGCVHQLIGAAVASWIADTALDQAEPFIFV